MDISSQRTSAERFCLIFQAKAEYAQMTPEEQIPEEAHAVRGGEGVRTEVLRDTFMAG